MITTSAKRTNTPETISFIKRLSNFICMKKVITILTLILAMISATATENAPKCHPVTRTEVVVKTRRITKIIARDE
jgi:hypothetical protein